jgi:starch phosphorylase
MTEFSLPERIDRLEELAYNLWWSWHERPRRLFRTLDYPLWRLGGHNPVKELRETSPENLRGAAADASFLELYDDVMRSYDASMNRDHTWFHRTYPDRTDNLVAYFSMEYAIHNSLPIYAGGLGILAGDICKEASDLGLPMVAVGFMYPQGYFMQRINERGQQEEIYRILQFGEAPVKRVLNAQGSPVLAHVKLADVELALGAWLVRVGRTDVYLLDAEFDENPTPYRHLSDRLYNADPAVRLQQEMVLGVGGVRVLRALGINPAVWHMNEGHTAFMALERVRELVVAGTNLDEACRIVQSRTVFTTHTPVAAGHDVFSTDLLQTYFRDKWDSLGLSSEALFELGQAGPDDRGRFNMTVLALQMSDHRCGVSQLHGEVSRRMWRGLWPELEEADVPISHVTNGVHLASWISPDINKLFVKHLGADWDTKYDEDTMCDRIQAIPDAEFWATRQHCQRRMAGGIRERMRNRWIDETVPWSQTLAMGALLDPDLLTIAFSRRFVEYKRPALIFRDIDRLKRIINNPWAPVQIVFAGKTHPADEPSKDLLRQVYDIAADRSFQGRIIFVEDFDMHVAHYLVQGVDVWLNTPRRLREASGTSGIKAAANGVLHMSVLDGWWHEGYRGDNGWAINRDLVNPDPETEDEADAAAIYELLEDHVVPLYYSRDINGVPVEWVKHVKNAICAVIPSFSARRMLKQCVTEMYLPAMDSE